MDSVDEGDVALIMISAIAAQLKANGLLDIEQLALAMRMMLSRPATDKQKEAANTALYMIQGLKGVASTSDGLAGSVEFGHVYPFERPDSA